MLKVGASAAGARGRGRAHRRGGRRPRASSARSCEEAGAAWAHDVHDLLELAKALAVRGARAARRGGLAILTCSGGDSGLGADEAQRARARAAARSRPTPPSALRELLPAAATVANPLDYTAMIWGEVETLRDIVARVGDDPAIDQVLVFYDQPAGPRGALRESWDAVARGHPRRRRGEPRCRCWSPRRCPSCSTTRPRGRSPSAGVAGGRRPAHRASPAPRRCAGAARRRRPPARDRRGRARRGAPAGRWLAEHEAKALLRRRAASASRPGASRATRTTPSTSSRELGAPRRAQARRRRAAPQDRGRRGGARARGRARRALGLPRPACAATATPAPTRAVLVEAMAPPGVELLVSARRDAVVPVLVVGLGGVWTEALDDVAVVPLPADAARVERALRSLRAAPLLAGTRTGAPVDVAAAAALAARAGALLLDRASS